MSPQITGMKVSLGVRLPVDKDVPDRDNKSESSDQQSEDNEKLSFTSEGEAIELSDMEALSPPRKLRNRDSIRKPKRYETNLIQYDIPTSFQEAITGPEAKEWTRAVEDDSREKRHVDDSTQNDQPTFC